MSPALKSFIALALGLVVGAVIGAYATTVILGRAPERLAPSAKLMCPPCPRCPEPQNEGGYEPPRLPPLPPMNEAPLPPPDLPPAETQAGLPGLPAAAIHVAGDALKRQVEPCRLEAKERGLMGSTYLDLTVTATGTIGRVQRAEIGKREGDVESLDRCLLDAAKNVQFQWSGPDGESRLRFPVRWGE